MKIIQLLQKPQWRGAEIFAGQLSDQLTALGHEVRIITIFENNANLPFAKQLIQFKRPLSKRFMDFSGWKMLAREVTSFQPDVIQANAGDTLKFAVLSKLFFGWKVPIVFRNANKVSDFVNTTPKLWFNKFLMTHVKHVISVSELCRQDFVKTYSFQSDKTTTVSIGIDLQPFPGALPADLVAFFSKGSVLVNVASFVQEKNHLSLLRIFHRLVTSGEDVKLILIGDGKLRTAIQQEVIDLNLTDRVFLAGYRNDVLSIIANAQAFVLPSKIEGLPGVILEAMYCKTPVVAYDVGGISEVVKNEATGWLVKAGDEEGFVKAVQEVLRGENLEEIKENAFKLVTREYDNREIAKRFLEVYNNLKI